MPLILRNMPVAIAFQMLFGVLHAFLYRMCSAGWPVGNSRHTWRLFAIIFSGFLFFEFFTPFNMFGEPIHLIAAELVFWGLIALSEVTAIVWVCNRGREVTQ